MRRLPSLAFLLTLLPVAAFAQAPAAVNGGIYLASPPTLSNGQASIFHLDSSGNLQANLPNGVAQSGSWTVTANAGTGTFSVNCIIGCAGGTFNNNSDAVATSATNGQSAAWLYGFNGATWDRLRVDGSKNLDVNCVVGCAGGTFNNNADGVATSATNGQSATWLYGWNGATFDRLRVDGSKNLNVNCAAGCTAGTAANNADAVAAVATGLGQEQSYPFLWNGATFDRWYGDKTNGAFVNIKTSATLTVTGTVAATQSGTWNDRMQDGSGTALTSTGSALDVNLKTSAITLPVSGAVTVTGSVTANAGTNLNTSLLAVETGGNLTTLAGGVTGAKYQVNLASVAAALHLSTNLDQIGGAALAFGQATMANSIPVVIASNQSAIPASQSGTWTVQQGTPPWQENITQIGGSTLTLGQQYMNNSLPVVIAPNQTAVPITQAPLTPPFQVSVVNNPLVPIAVNLVKSVPNAARCTNQTCVRGSGSSTSNAAVTLIAAQPRDLWITGVQCGRTDAATTGMIVTLSDAASTIVVLPNGGGGGGNNLWISPDSPLYVKAGTAFTFTPGTSVSTSYCNAQGYLG